MITAHATCRRSPRVTDQRQTDVITANEWSVTWAGGPRRGWPTGRARRLSHNQTHVWGHCARVSHHNQLLVLVWEQHARTHARHSKHFPPTWLTAVRNWSMSNLNQLQPDADSLRYYIPSLNNQTGLKHDPSFLNFNRGHISEAAKDSGQTATGVSEHG